MTLFSYNICCLSCALVSLLMVWPFWCFLELNCILVYWRGLLVLNSQPAQLIIRNNVGGVPIAISQRGFRICGQEYLIKEKVKSVFEETKEKVHYDVLSLDLLTKGDVESECMTKNSAQNLEFTLMRILVERPCTKNEVLAHLAKSYRFFFCQLSKRYSKLLLINKNTRFIFCWLYVVHICTRLIFLSELLVFRLYQSVI